jgi:hypothetical protein
VIRFRALAALSPLLLAACASVPTADQSLVAAARAFTPAAGKGRIYVYRHGAVFGAATRQTVMVDGSVIGRLARGTFLMVEVDPGTHTVAAQGENEDALQVAVDAGRCTFIEVWPQMGVWTARAAMKQVGEEEGRRAVNAYRMTVPQ